MRKRINNNLHVLIIAGIYAAIVFVAYWSILLGENLMKGDIWSSHYPLQVVTSDALDNGTFPLWNPLLNFGTPYYAVVGTPVWYPITLIFDLIGYTPFMGAWEYAFHVVLGCLGMRWLCLAEFGDIENADKKKTVEKMSFIAGLAYGFSGVFFSNAQHIMIIISAAWIPYVFFFAKRYLDTNIRAYLYASSASISMILLGGYPELLFDTVIVLFAWIVINIDEELKLRLCKALRVYCCIGFFSILASGITIIPFIKLMPLITRGSGQWGMETSYSSIVSMLFPVTEDRLAGTEISMNSFYISLIVLIPILYLCVSKNNKRVFSFLFFSIISLLFALGRKSFLHAFAYRFFPMYSTFRFSTMWRVFFFVFLILAATHIWMNIIEKKIDILADARFSIIVAVVSVAGMSCYMIKYFIIDDQVKSNANAIFGSLMILLFFFIVYRVALLYSKNIAAITPIIVIVVVIECLSVADLYFPVTMARYGKNDYYTPAVQHEIENEIAKWDNRNINCDFANNERASSGLMDSNAMAFEHLFDDGGYLSARLQSVEDYKGTANYLITLNNPEVYFTNNIVETSSDGLKEWLNDETIDASCVAVDSKNGLAQNGSIMEAVNVSHFGFNSLSFAYDAPTDGIVTVLQANYPGWKLYVDGSEQEIVEVDGCFMGIKLTEGKHEVVLKFRPMDLLVGFSLSFGFYVLFLISIVRYVNLLKKEKIER